MSDMSGSVQAADAPPQSELIPAGAEPPPAAAPEPEAAPEKPEAATDEKPAEATAQADKPKTAAKEEPVKWRDAGDEDPGYTAARQDILDDLAKRRQELDGREKAIVTREALLKAGEQELDRKFQEMTQLRKEIEKLLETQSEEEKARVASLVKIYENMKPKDAARIFDTLDLDILVMVLGQMSERKLSPIMAQMNPERARTVTIMLAEQKQLPDLPASN
jgi:flagellar motility protein MotE (MotC chaperone)